MLAGAYAARERSTVDRWRERLESLTGKGRLAIWGAGAKGATFANLIDPDCRRIDCVVDINPSKQGKFLPGTGHPIVDVRSLRPRGVTAAVLMNPNYRDECLSLLAAAQVRIDLIDWI